MELWNLSSYQPGTSPLVVAMYGEEERRRMEGRRGWEGEKKEEGGGEGGTKGT